MPMVLRLFKIYRSGAMKNLVYTLLAITLAIPSVAFCSSYYAPPRTIKGKLSQQLIRINGEV